MTEKPSPHRSAPERFHSLDVLRGIAAFSVVLWHWQHFFFFGTEPGKVDLARLPFYEWISILYTKGLLAVDLFFSLSGFVFYWLYAKRVAAGEISPGKFALLRFSRLYPLHLATLGCVVGLQALHRQVAGVDFVYPANDAALLVRQLFLATDWAGQPPFSFNGPIWSISGEVAV